MSAARTADLLRQLEHTGASDAELLARFVATKDGGAFGELVRRHGALVLGVCRRVTGQVQDAEDAFQATFLVLARRAASVRDGARLWSWLYGTAFRVAWRARRAARRRRTREVPVARMPEPHAPPLAPPMPELAPILDEELAALPAHYREALVLCDLRGASRGEAAAALGVPEGTLSSRLANGRKKLAARLTKRGVALAVGALPGALTEVRAATTVPTELIAKTCGRAADYATGGAAPGPLAELVEGGFTVRKTLVFGLLTLAVVAGGAFAARPEHAPPDEAPKPPAVAEKPAVAPRPDAGRRDEPAKARKVTTDDVIKRWAPKLKNATDYHQIGGSPERSPGVAAYSFKVVGPTFEELWTHYAQLCGVKERYAEKTFLTSANTGPNGSYVVSDRPSADGTGRRGLSVFLLKTDAYTVTVTFQPGPDGKSIVGSLSVVVP
jgi:RNA polymerase sigma factor (sigma-70 family)